MTSDFHCESIDEPVVAFARMPVIFLIHERNHEFRWYVIQGKDRETVVSTWLCLLLVVISRGRE
jgi:hypothetical protein